MKRLEVTIKGEVQGVSFRYFVYEKARELGLVGTVKNMPEGEVSIVAEGEEAALQELLESVTRGPRFAKIEKVESTWKESTGEFAKFSIIY